MQPATDQTNKLWYDTATLIEQGRRERQEDAVVSDFPVGSDMGFVVLADGMGGHAAGDVASKIVVTEVFSELKLRSGDRDALRQDMGEILRNAAYGANDCIQHYSRENDASQIMGSTLLAPVLLENKLFWISVGDSPFFLIRKDGIHRLNQDHSVGSQIEFLVSSGMMNRVEAMNHPEQNSLTSVIIGQDIPQIDCPETPREMQDGDILIAASDGLLVLHDNEILNIVQKHSARSARQIASALLRGVEGADDPNQDNVTLCIIKINSGSSDVPAEIIPANQPSTLQAKSGRVTIIASVSGQANARA